MSGAYLLLEDGTRLDGDAAGAPGHTVGEVVFNTSMSGYQESVTDPSYRAQIIVFTYPLVGNYGVSEEAMESAQVHARGVVMREGVDRDDAPGSEGGWLTWLADCGVPSITGIDTRALVRHIRDKGAMLGGIFPADMPEERARELIDAEPSMDGRDLACEVTPAEPVILNPDAPGPRVVAIDTGIKNSIVENLRQRGVRLELHPCSTSADELLARDPDAVFLANGPGDPAALDYVVENLRQRGVRLELHPCSTSADELLARDPDAVFLANGPGDPAALDYVVENVRGVVGKVPVFGICMGHQLLCRAVGLETFKLPFGHRGANHPVKDLGTGKIDITSQNHGFAVQGPAGEGHVEADDPVRWETDFGAAELSHVNLYDRTVEGLLLRDVKGATAQYHPEAGPGPHDATYLFDRYLEMIA